MLDRLVAIAVAESDLVARHAGHQNDPVRGRGAIGDRIAAMGTEDAGGIALALADRPGMVEERAELGDRDREVGAQQALTEEVEEGPAYRRLEEGGAPGVAGGMPGILMHLREADERGEHRRQ